MHPYRGGYLVSSHVLLINLFLFKAPSCIWACPVALIIPLKYTVRVPLMVLAVQTRLPHCFTTPSALLVIRPNPRIKTAT